MTNAKKSAVIFLREAHLTRGAITVFPSSSNTTLFAIKRGACGNSRRFLLLILPLRPATH